jgi:hypothetical protein
MWRAGLNACRCPPAKGCPLQQADQNEPLFRLGVAAVDGLAFAEHAHVHATRALPTRIKNAHSFKF